MKTTGYDSLTGGMCVNDLSITDCAGRAHELQCLPETRGGRTHPDCLLMTSSSDSNWLKPFAEAPEREQLYSELVGHKSRGQHGKGPGAASRQGCVRFPHPDAAASVMLLRLG